MGFSAREVRPHFNPEVTVSEFAALMKTYRIHSVSGDRYAGEWVSSQFRKAGIHYQAADRAKSDLYRDLLPLINSGAVALLENERMVSQLIALERRAGRSGKDVIDHPPGAHDDLANAVAGAVVMVGTNAGRFWATDDLDDDRYATVAMTDPLAGW